MAATEKHKIQMKALYTRDKVKRNKLAREYYYKNRDLVREKNKAYAKANPDKVAAWARKSKTGFSPELVQQLFKAQAGKCGICQDDITIRKAHADHCHETNTPRGLLCSRCNTSLGGLGDNKAGLLRALAYLRITPVELLK